MSRYRIKRTGKYIINKSKYFIERRHRVLFFIWWTPYKTKTGWEDVPTVKLYMTKEDAENKIKILKRQDELQDLLEFEAFIKSTK